MKSYGPETCLFRVAAMILQRLQEYANVRGSGIAFYNASLCHIIGFGTNVDLNKAITPMRRSAALGCLRAKGLYATLRASIPNETKGANSPDSVTNETELIHFEDISQAQAEDLESTRHTTALNDTDIEWSVQAMLTGSRWAATHLEACHREHYEKALADLRTSYQGVGLKLELSSIDGEVGELDCKGKGKSRSFPDLDIHRLALAGDFEAMDSLLDRTNVSTEAVNKDGETPLICAVRAGHLHIVDLLLRHGAQLEAIDNRGATILHWLISLTQKEIRQLRSFLPASLVCQTTRVPISYSQHYGSTMLPGTPLDWAIDARHLSVIAVLMELGANSLDETAG